LLPTTAFSLVIMMQEDKTGKGGKIQVAGKGRSKGRGKWVPISERHIPTVITTRLRNQPSTGIAFEALEEIVGFWTTKTEKYRITDSWKILKATKRGRVTWVHDLTWDDVSCTIMWGDDFFFDPVDLYTSADKLHWYAQSDPNKLLASYVLSKSEQELEGFDGAQMSAQERRQNTNDTPTDIAIPSGATCAPRTRQRGKFAKEPETITLQWWEGDLEVDTGDMLRVVAIGGDHGEIITLETTNTNRKSNTGSTQSRTTHPAVASSSRLPIKQKQHSKGGSERKISTLTNGCGAEVLEFISGLWVGNRGETYNLTTDWRCVKTSTGGRKEVFNNLSWNDEHGLILWGSSYMFDAADLESVEKDFQLTWYHQSDQAKLNPMFIWSKA